MILFLGADDAEVLFWQFAGARDRSGGNRGVTARGGRTLRGECEFGGEVAAALTRERERRAAAARGSVCPWKSSRRGYWLCCRIARPDFGGDRCGAAQAADSNQPQPGVFSSDAASLSKKACKPRNGNEQMWPERADVGSESKACLIPPGWYLSMRRRSAPIWCGSGGGRHGASD